MIDTSSAHHLIIIGGGPAGHTAAIYAARANLQPLMFEGFLAGGIAAGGQLTTTTEVENFPGFPDGIDGTELMNRMRQQSIKSGAQVLTETIESVDLDRSHHDGYLMLKSQTGLSYLTQALIIATGATAKKLEVPGVDTYRNKGISGCAVCDGALPMFRNKHLVVVGGGDVAMEEANHLTHFASQVTVLVRSDTLRASQAMIHRAKSNPKITFLYWTELQEVYGNDNLITGISIINNQSQEVSNIDCGGLFFAIGHIPNTSFLSGQLEIDEYGYIITTARLTLDTLLGKNTVSEAKQQIFAHNTHYQTSSSVSGVFAAGDVSDKIYRQAVTSAGSGCMAALEAEHWLQAHHKASA